ncbi:hypothetical protein Tco_0081228 [Tanacetum coccineum]
MAAVYDKNKEKSGSTVSRQVQLGGIKLIEAKVVDKAVVVATAVGTLPEVPAAPIKFSADKGLTKGTQTSIRADRCAATFSLILST